MKQGLNLSVGKGVAVMAVLALGFAVPGVAQAPSLAMLDGLSKGEWTIRSRDGELNRRVCLSTGRELIQLRHSGPACERFVVDDNVGQVTVQYTCPGNGYGRTSIRKETSALVQLESQGIAGGLPFQFSAEARRTGSCR